MTATIISQIAIILLAIWAIRTNKRINKLEEFSSVTTDGFVSVLNWVENVNRVLESIRAKCNSGEKAGE